MRLGKFHLTSEHTKDAATVAAMSKFINGNVIILERIVAIEERTGQFIVMIGISESFDEVEDRVSRIPQYELTRESSIITTEGTTWKFKRMENPK